jgi:mannose-6-phosphate isomerase-like protein (cupin superfamily)
LNRPAANRPGQADRTRGAYAIWMHASQPGVSPPRRKDEIIHVLDGELRVWCDGTAFTVGCGDTITLPRCLPHSFRVTSPKTVRMMITVVPGGFERFYTAVARLRLPNDIPELLDIGEAFGIDYVGRRLLDSRGADQAGHTPMAAAPASHRALVRTAAAASASRQSGYRVPQTPA